jgi:hypothetical protein
MLTSIKSSRQIIKIENQVWLFIKNIQIDRSFRKLDVLYFTIKKKSREFFIETNHLFIIIRRDWRRREIRRKEHHWLTIDKKID